MRPLAAALIVVALTGQPSSADTSFSIVPLSNNVNPYKVAPDVTGGVWITDRQHRTVNHVSVGDINGDGIPDIVITPEVTGNLIVPESIATAPNGVVAFTFNTTGLDGSPLESDIGVLNASNPSNLTIFAMPPDPNFPLSQDTCANADCGIGIAPDGDHVFSFEQNVNKLVMATLSTHTVKVFDLKFGQYPVALAIGPDGSAAVTEFFGGQAGGIAQLSPSGVLTETPFPNYPAHDKPESLVFDRDGTLYIGTSQGGLVKMTPDHQFLVTGVPADGEQTSSLTLGPDLNIWMIRSGGTSAVEQWVLPNGPLNEFPVADAPSGLASSGGTLFFVGFPLGSFDGKLYRAAIPVAAAPNVQAKKTHLYTPIPPGAQHVSVTYSITLTNTGNKATSGDITITDYISGGDVLFPPAGCNTAFTGTGVDVQCTAHDSLAPGQSVSFTFTATVPVPATRDAIRNQATFRGGGAPPGASNEDMIPILSRFRAVGHQ